MLADEVGDGASRLDPWCPRAPWLRRACDAAPLDEIVERIGLVYRREPGDCPTAARDDDVCTVLHPIKMLAKTVMELAHTHLVVGLM